MNGYKNPNYSKKPTVLLADPPFTDKFDTYTTTFANLGILYLSSFLRQQYPEVNVVYLDGFCSVDEHLKKIEKHAPIIYGISFSSFYAHSCYRLINRVRQRHPELLIVCGGCHPTVDHRDVLNNSAADICCIGEGEETFLDIVKTYVAQRQVLGIAGTAFKNHEGKIMVNPLRELIKTLDNLPFPAWDLVNFNKYSGCRKKKSSPSAAIVASRGCPFNCTFCSNPVWKLQLPWIRKRTPENIAEEVELLYGMGVREIYIRTDTMNVDLEWCTNVFNMLSGLGHSDLYFQCNLRARPINKPLAEAMKRANCWLAHIGIESGSQRVLDGIGKNVTLEDIENICLCLKEKNISIHSFMMLFNAWEAEGQLKVETTREVWQSLKMMVKYKWKGLIDYMSWSCACPHPGSELFRVALKYGLVKADAKNDAIRALPHEFTMELPGITRFSMKMVRTVGLMLQAIFIVFSRDFYTKENLISLSNLKTALVKIKYMFFD